MWGLGSQWTRYNNTRNCSYGAVTGQVRQRRTCSSISSHHDLIPESHTRTSKKVSKDRQRRTFFIACLSRSSYKNFLWPSKKNGHTSTNAQHLQELNARTSWGRFQQDLHKIFSQGPVQVMQGPLNGSHQDLGNSSPQGTVKDLSNIFMPGLPKTISADRYKRTCCC